MRSIINRVLILLIMLSAFGANNLMAYEEPEYKVIKEYDEFEIREYSSYLVAETEVKGEFEDAGNIAFKVLFDYISGNNLRKEEIEMTIPVNQRNPDLRGEEIEMTTPVSQSTKLNSDGKFVISFVLPSKYNLETAPLPKDSRVKINEIPARLVAVRKYSGTWSEDNYRENESLLLEEVDKNGLAIVGEPVYARYNPPFWPWFLRRNEVLVEVSYKN